VLGDAREIVALRQAGLPRARAVVATINDDLANIEIALTARAARPDIRVILRVFGEELDHNLERGFGPNAAFSASALAAPTFAAAAVSREVEYVMPAGAELLGVTSIAIQPDSQLSGFVRAIEEQHGIRVLDHHDAAGRPVRRELMRQLSSGDHVMLLGTLGALEALRLKNVRGSKFGFLSALPLQHPTEQFDTVIVCGLGKVGNRVVNQLHRMRPRPRIVVIRLDDGRADLASRIGQLDDVTILVGDARDPNVLRAAGIERAYTIAALTSDDLLNLHVGLAARRERADVHVVLRVFSDALAEKLADMFGIRTIYSTSALAAPTLAAAAVLGGITHAFFAGGGLFSTDQVAVGDGDSLSGDSLERIQSRHSALVIALNRAGHTRALPPLDTTLAPGDEITLLATVEALAQLRAGQARRPNVELHAASQQAGREKI
jgi:Trk K+ transport system NAD-binding subunit